MTSILIAWIFTIFWLLKFQGYFEIWKIDLIKIDWTFEVNLSFIKYTMDYIFYFCWLIFDLNKEAIKEYFSKYTLLTNKDVYIIIVFLFHFIFTFILTWILKLFPGHNDRRYFTLWVITIYLLLIYFVKSIV
jgi:hypothetical protein